MFTFSSKGALSSAVKAMVVASVMVVALPGTADAAICGSYAQVKDLLSNRYKESPKSVGMVADQGVVQLFTSDGGTWSIILTSTQGRSCVIAAGHTWQDIKQVMVGAPA